MEERKAKGERGADWHSGVETGLRDVERELERGKISRDEALRTVSGRLGIEKSYDPHYRSLEEYLRRYK